MEMKKFNKLEYTYKKITERDYYLTYVLKNTEGDILMQEDDRPYRVCRTLPASEKELRGRIAKTFFNINDRFWKVEGGIRVICMNDFDEDKGAQQLTMPQVDKPSVVPAHNDNERVYEVVKQGTVWTIVKRSEPLYTTEQAKTILFQRIVNG